MIKRKIDELINPPETMKGVKVFVDGKMGKPDSRPVLYKTVKSIYHIYGDACFPSESQADAWIEQTKSIVI